MQDLVISSDVDRFKEILLISLLEYVCINVHDNKNIHDLITNKIENIVTNKDLLKDKSLIQKYINYFVNILTQNKELEIISQTDNSLVYKSHNVLDNNVYAIKKIKTKKLYEIQILAKLDHPNIIRYYNAWKEKKYIYIQMQLCKYSLKDYIESRHNIDLNINKKYMLQLALGLQYLHQNNIYHGDLETRNILIDNENNIRISDFGLAKTKAQTLDIKQLGLIYFELNYKMNTLMEKYKTIELIKTKSIYPNDFNNNFIINIINNKLNINEIIISLDKLLFL